MQVEPFLGVERSELGRPIAPVLVFGFLNVFHNRVSHIFASRCRRHHLVQFLG